MANSTKNKKASAQETPVQTSHSSLSKTRSRPTAAGILLLIGGLFIMGFAIVGLSTLNYVMSNYGNYTSVLNATTLASIRSNSTYITEISVLITIFGIVISILGVFSLLYSNILRFAKHIAIVVAALSIISLWDSGGLFIGTILSVIGAILLFIYKG